MTPILRSPTIFSHSRLLRFEEKSYLKQEIEQLNEKYGEEERNSSNLERQLKKYTSDKIALDQKISDLEREQNIGKLILKTFVFYGGYFQKNSRTLRYELLNL